MVEMGTGVMVSAGVSTGACVPAGFVETMVKRLHPRDSRKSERMRRSNLLFIILSPE
jgi:hypothetical protein